MFKLFADDTSIFSIVHNMNKSKTNLNNDLNKIKYWAIQWKMNFNPDPSKQAQEVIFSRRLQKTNHNQVYFNHNSVKQVPFQKHLGMYLDTKLNFQESLVTVYKAFIRLHLDYRDIIYDQTYNEYFHQKMDSIQYNGALAITDTVRGTSREKLYQELGLETLRQRRWYRKLCYFFEILKCQSPAYLFRIPPHFSKAYNTRTNNKIPLFSGEHNFFINSFFPSTVIEWNNLDLKIRNSKTFSAFKKSILKFIRPSSNSIFNCHSPKEIKLITRLRLVLSHLREHKFQHNFQDILNPICSCGDAIKTTVHYLLHCPNFLDERMTLLDNLQSIGENIHNKNDSQISELLLFGVSSNNDASNTCILNATIQYIMATKRFDVPLTYS